MDRTERQKLGIKRWITSGCQGTLAWATGTGKTTATMMAIEKVIAKKPDADILIVVPTQVLKDQWLNDYIIPRNLLSNCRVVIVNTAIKEATSCDLLVCDEAHLFCSDVLRAIFKVVNYDMVLCLSATLERLDGKEVLIKQLAPVCDTITIKEAMAEGWLSPIDNYLVLLDVDLSDYQEANRVFNSVFAFFNYDFNLAMTAATQWQQRAKIAKAMCQPLQVVTGKAMLFMKYMRARKEFIQKHPKKIEVCNKIIEARKDKKIITFSPTIEHAKKIDYDFILHSQQKKKENAEVMEKFNKVDHGVIASSKALNAGVDVKGLSVGIEMSVNSSSTTSIQRLGRVIRFEPGKKAEMFTLILRGTKEEDWFINSNRSDFIVLDEKLLDDVLAGKQVKGLDYQHYSNKRFRY